MRRPSATRMTFFYLALVAALVYTAFPVYWTLNTALLPPAELAAVPAVYAPVPPQFGALQRVLENRIFLAGMRNSIIVAGGATLLSLGVGALAAYALARFKFPGRRPLQFVILAMTMFPNIAVVGPLFLMVVKTGLFNTPAALILSYLINTLPFTVWVLSSFFKSLPHELEESAYVDGATPFQAFWRVMLPLAAPGMATAGLLAFINSWNEYLFALSFTADEKARTVPVVVAQFGGDSEFQIPWGDISAGSLIATLPLLVLVLLCQRRLVSGLTAGAVKG